MAAAMEQHIQLAQTLPRQLLHLFKRWPPHQIARLEPRSPIPANALPATFTTVPSEQGEEPTTKQDPLKYAVKTNPFLAWKNPRTGNWHGAHYSLRRQADLFKLAKQFNVLPLMPKSPKHPEVKEAKRLKLGLRIKGTGVGQKVKGHKWERQLGAKLDARRKAMADMPELIKTWKQTGHGRGWKKWPK